MQYPFKTKKAQLKTIFAEKLEINTISIENKSDVKSTIEILLNYIELESILTPIECSYNFMSKDISFQLELNTTKSKQDFFKAIKKFSDFIGE